MSDEQLFRWIFVIIFVVTFSISGYFRGKARQSGGVIERVQEGWLILGLRMLFAAALYLPIVAYMISPDWMAWSQLNLPVWLRWVGVVVGLGMLPIIYWVMISIGKNISETYLTKEGHVLVTDGPYRWVRHPLYSVATTIFVALGLIAANWFILVVSVVAILVIVLVIIPKEEEQLILKFGDGYRQYQQQVGRLVPRLGWHR